jgi:hypothetical protein
MLIKVALKLNFTFISSVSEIFDIFLLSILKNCSRRMKHDKNVTSSLKHRRNLYEFNKKNQLPICFQWFISYRSYIEALQPRKNDDR